MFRIADESSIDGAIVTRINKITPQIEQKVAMQLDKWFGYEISMVDEQ